MFRVALSVLACTVLACTLPAQDAPQRVLPGLQRDGFVQLPNGWKLKPTGRHLDIGDLPVNVQLHPTGQYAAVLHSGMREHDIHIIDLNSKNRKIVSRATLDQAFYGLAWSPDGKQIYASGGEFDVIHAFDFDKGLLSNHRKLDVSGASTKTKKTVPSGVTLNPQGTELFTTAMWADAVIRIPLNNPENRINIPLTYTKEQVVGPMGEGPSPDDGRVDPNKLDVDPNDLGTKPLPNTAFPYTAFVEPNGKRLFVSLWAKSGVAVIDLETNKLTAVWGTASHPTEMVYDAKQKVLYVSCANSTQVHVLDVETGKQQQAINTALYPNAANGNTPNSIDLSPDGELLFVANADVNNVAVFNVSTPRTAKPLGFIPTGWYPTSVRFNKLDKTIYVSNGKGAVTKANPSGPNPGNPADRTLAEYIGSLYRGTFSAIVMPTPAEMAKLTEVAYSCSPLQKDSAITVPEKLEANHPIPTKIGGPSPIKHCIYIVKENRTYDQILGDMAARKAKPKGNGEPNLCLFPEDVTPNHHKLSDEFVLLDNFYVEGEISADGHEWTMGAYATDFVEKMWPMSYRGSPGRVFGYPAEGAIDYAARPAGGYLWDRAAEAKVTYRSYGEWVANGKKNPDGTFEDGVATAKSLIGHIDPQFRGYDLDYTDVDRAKRFISELKRFEQLGEMPRLQIVRLPNDHTSGTRVGKPTPTAQVADNDLALGLLVEAVSKSKFWESTAIFVVEDDAQNGPDHVDAHRIPAMVISPYTKRDVVDSTMYSTSSMLRTMELILGMQPMSQFDAAAKPMYKCFSAKKDLTPYNHVVPKTDLNELNRADAWGARMSAQLNLEVEDAADDLIFNEIIWKAVRGANSECPPPVRAAFFAPIKAKKPYTKTAGE